LEYVELGIAMGNAGEELKTRADFVTKKASEGGILFALEKFHIV
ncbi:HAD hydrolase family protein, partial [Bacillus cereus group sp. Bce025]